MDTALSVVKFEAELTREDKSNIKSIEFEFANGKLDFQVEIINDVQYKLALLAKIEATIASDLKVWEKE